VNVIVLASMYDIRTKMAREILGELRNHFGDKMFKTVVNFNTKIKEAASFGQPIGEYDPASRGQADFRTLAEELISAEGKGEHHEMVNTLAGQLEKISSTADELLREAKTVSPRMERRATREPIAMSSAEPQKPAVAEAAPAAEPKEAPKSMDGTPKFDKSNFGTMDEKLSDYYGVTQINDAVMFVSLYPHAKDVYIAGDFNSWHPTKTKMEKVGSSGIWQTKLQLPSGKYRYRMVVDGKWQQDPYNEVTETNPYGDMNSVLEVK